MIAALVAGVAIGGGLLWLNRAPGPETITGSWLAEVAYPWNLTLEERYDFSVRGGRIEGEASFLGVARAVEDAQWADGRLHFLTRSQSVLGKDPPRENVQRYEMWREGDALRVRLVIHRSHSVDAPLEFLAQRRKD